MTLRRAFRNFPKDPAELDRLLRDISVAQQDIGTDELAQNAVTNSILADMAALSVKARASNTSGDPSDLAASANGQYLQRNGDILQFAGVAVADITADHITPHSAAIRSFARQLPQEITADSILQHLMAIRSFMPRSEPKPDEFQVVMANRVFGAR